MRTLNLLALTTCASAFVFTACSDDDDPVPSAGGTGGTTSTMGGSGGTMAGGTGGMAGGAGGGMMAGAGGMAGGAGGGMMAGGAGGMAGGAGGGMMAGGAGGMAGGAGGGMMAGGAGGMPMTGAAPCNGCVELGVTYPAGGPTDGADEATFKQTNFQVNFDPPLDLTGATATIRVAVAELNPDTFIQGFVQNGAAEGFSGNFAGNIVLNDENFTPGEFIDIPVSTDVGVQNPAAVVSVGVQLGGNDDRAAGGTVIAYVDSIVFTDEPTEIPDVEFTDSEEGMFANGFQSPPGSTVVHVP